MRRSFIVSINTLALSLSTPPPLLSIFALIDQLRLIFVDAELVHSICCFGYYKGVD